MRLPIEKWFRKGVHGGEYDMYYERERKLFPQFVRTWTFVEVDAFVDTGVAFQDIDTDTEVKNFFCGV